MSRFKYFILDSITMFKRCLLISLRNLETLFMSMITPIILMLVFVFVFGGAVDVGNYDYTNYICPGIIILCISQCASITAVSVNRDMTTGVIDRFRSMSISKSSVLTGQVLAAVVRNIITTVIIIGVALLVGFRPEADFIEWLIIAAILLLYIFAITWLSVVFGLLSSSAESANSFTFIIIVLPYLSSGFTTTDTMPYALRIFAENQPVTPAIESVRALMLNNATGNNIPLAIIWCAAIVVVSYIAAVNIYKRKLAK